jgi:hypothetical protein
MKNIKQLAIVFAIATLNVCAQENTNDDKPIRIGVSIKGNTFSNNELNLRVMPPAKIGLNFDIMKYARVDLHFGFAKNSSDQSFPPSNYKMTLVDKTSEFTFGIFGMYKVDKVNFYGGLRFGSIGYSTEDTFYQPNASTPTKYINKGKIRTTLIAFGAEYFLHSKFSVGAEIGIGFYNDKYTPGNPGLATAPPVQKTKTSGTEAGLVFRFYPL